MKTYTPNQAAKALDMLEGALLLTNVRAIRRVLGRTKTLTLRAFRSRGIGRAIFGKNPAGARKLIKTTRVEVIGKDFYRVGLDLKGFVALQETGGQTKPHPIRAKGSGRLAFEGKPGDLTRPRSVRHPGGRVARFPAAEPIMRAQAPAFVKEMEMATEKAAKEFG